MSAAGAVGRSQAENYTYVVGEKFGQKNNRSLIFINGILNDRNDAASSANSLAKKVQEMVVGIYNPSLSENCKDVGLIEIIGQCILGESEKHSRIIIIAHSHGAFLTHQTLSQQSIREIKDKIEVVTLGPAKVLNTALASRVENYINPNDIISQGAQIFEMPKPPTLPKNGYTSALETLNELGKSFVEYNALASYATQLAIMKNNADNPDEAIQNHINNLYESAKRHLNDEEYSDPALQLVVTTIAIIAIHMAKTSYSVHVTESAVLDDFIGHSFASYLDKAVTFIESSQA